MFTLECAEARAGQAWAAAARGSENSRAELAESRADADAARARAWEAFTQARDMLLDQAAEGPSAIDSAEILEGHASGPDGKVDATPHTPPLTRALSPANSSRNSPKNSPSAPNSPASDPPWAELASAVASHLQLQRRSSPARIWRAEIANLEAEIASGRAERAKLVQALQSTSLVGCAEEARASELERGLQEEVERSRRLTAELSDEREATASLRLELVRARAAVASYTYSPTYSPAGGGSGLATERASGSGADGGGDYGGGVGALLAGAELEEAEYISGALRSQLDVSELHAMGLEEQRSGIAEIAQSYRESYPQSYTRGHSAAARHVSPPPQPRTAAPPPRTAPPPMRTAPAQASLSETVGAQSGAHTGVRAELQSALARYRHYDASSAAWTRARRDDGGSSHAQGDAHDSAGAEQQYADADAQLSQSLANAGAIERSMANAGAAAGRRDEAARWSGAGPLRRYRATQWTPHDDVDVDPA